jgi:hypothetical protein
MYFDFEGLLEDWSMYRSYSEYFGLRSIMYFGDYKCSKLGC